MRDGPRIIKNAAQCNRCQDIIESRTVHEFRQCSCKSIAVDGGKEYIKRVGESSAFKDLSRFMYDDGLVVDDNGKPVDD